MTDRPPFSASPRTAIVVGGGVVGVSAAWALAESGIQVTLVTDGSVGDGATAANGGLLVPSDSVVWPSPQNARAVPLTILGRGGQDIAVRWTAPGLLRWGIGFLGNSTPKRHRQLNQFVHALSRYSLAVTSEWNDRLGLDFSFDENGMLFLSSTEGGITGTISARDALAAAGETYRRVDDLATVDKALAFGGVELRGVFTPGAAHGDSQAFAKQLSNRLVATGAVLAESRQVTSLRSSRGKVIGVSTDDGAIEADAVVLAAGFRSRELAATADVRLPILPVKGYAATVPIKETDRVSAIGGVLVDEHIAFSRTATHLRLTTGAEIGRKDRDVPADVRQRLVEAGERLFPGALGWDGASYEAGHRPMTPSGVPLIGQTNTPGLFVDTGHGSLGWTQAAGSAQLLTALVLGQTPQLDPHPYLATGNVRRGRLQESA